MTRFSSVLAVVSLLTFITLGCGEGLTPDTADLSGQWSGSSGDVTLNLTLSEASDGSLSGSGSIAGPGDSFSLTVTSGTHTGNSFSMVLNASGIQEDATYSGTVAVLSESGSTGPDGQVQLQGQLDGSGFDNFQITLNR